MTTTNLLVAVVTAYCACRACCGPTGAGITASGSEPVAGRTIAAPKWVPFGSRVRVGARWYVAEDRMSRRFPDRFDIYFHTHQEALKWGKRTNKVVVVTK